MKNLMRLFFVIISITTLSSCGYNSMVEKEEAVNTAWSNVENQYQRRADLIPNLVNTVKGYTTHEQETLESVVNARSKATQITLNAENMTPEKLKEYQAIQGEVGSALSRLLAVTENYPELKANQNFQELQAQLEGTENRISVERRNFNQERKITTLIFANFPTTCLPACLALRKNLISKQKQAMKKHLKSNFNKSKLKTINI